jgi:hypothetical protein
MELVQTDSRKAELRSERDIYPAAVASTLALIYAIREPDDYPNAYLVHHRSRRIPHRDACGLDAK